MSSIWVLLAFGASLLLALLLLFVFKARAWYWHILSIALSLTMGFVPPPSGWHGPGWDLLFGALFAFLFVWGLGGLLIYQTHHHHTKHA